MTVPGLLAAPYDWTASPNHESNTLILDEVVAHPQWMAGGPMSPEERRILAAGMLADLQSPKWGVWESGNLVGILYLGEVQGRVDARFHFLFMDRNLVGKRALLGKFLTYCFETLGFRRLSAVVPEDADKLLRFYRKLGFTYEGECKATGLTPTAFLAAGAPGLRPIENAPAWIARQGARTEGVFWRDDRWIDVLRLRLTKEEHRTHADLRKHTDHHSERPERPLPKS